jgi:hypothetical protein
MSTPRRTDWSELDRAAAEDLILGGPQAWRSDPRRVAALLVAAAAPAGARELAGEEGAAMAFRTVARHRAVARKRRPAHGVRAAIARALTIKVAVLATGALGAVGLVYAVGAGDRINALPNGGASAVHSEAPPPPAQKAVAPPTHASPSARPTPTSGSGAGQRSLCREYVQRDRRDRARMLDDPSFDGLRDSAGVSGTDRDRDRDRVRMDDYCTRVLDRDSDDRSNGGSDDQSDWSDDGHSNDPDPYDPHRPHHPVA